MARIRTIKPDFWTDEKLTECSLTARLLFIGTWNFADDNGNLDRSSKQIKARIFPIDNIDCEPLIQELIAQGLLIEYSINDKKYLHIQGFAKHQVINRPSKPSCPEYKYSLNTQGVLNTEGKGREGKGEEGDAPADSSHEEKRQKLVSDSCLALRNAGVMDFTSIHPTFNKLIDLGVTAEEFEDCAKNAKYKKFNYIVQAIAGRREDANNLVIAKKEKVDADWKRGLV